jgi:hypothetical protein
MSPRRRRYYQVKADGQSGNNQDVLGYGSDVSTYGGGVGGYGWLGRGGGYSVSGGAIDFSGNPRARYIGNRLGASGPIVGWGGTGFDGYSRRHRQ